MRKLILAPVLACIASLGILVSMAHAAEPVPCEDMLKNLREAVKTAKLSEADSKKVADLEDKGIERCNADDDKRADALFAEAMKIMGK